MSTDELLANALRILETCLPVSNNSCGKLVLSSESPIMLGDNLITTSFSFFLLQTLIYQVVNLIILHLLYCIEAFYIFKN